MTRMMRSIADRRFLAGLAAIVVPAFYAWGSIVGPYSPDAYTVHLYHLDEAAGATATANAGLAGGMAHAVDNNPASAAPPLVGMVLGASGYPGFGNAADYGANTDYMIGFDGNGSGAFQAETSGTALSPDRISLSTLGIGGANPFTLEALVNFAAEPGNREIIATDSSAGTRGFQFRLTSGGATGRRLEFNLIGSASSQRFAEIPVDGPHAFALGVWFHAAFVYDGSSSQFYWTVLDPAQRAANAIGSLQPLTVSPTAGSIQGPLVLGNENRAASGEGIYGMLDEVRISNIARGIGEMMFYSAEVFVIEGPAPANQTVTAGFPASFAISVGGANPSYQWRRDGVDIPGATNAAFTIPAASLADAGSYSVWVTNATSSLLSEAAILDVRVPAMLTWNPTADYTTWNTGIANWLEGAIPTSYQPGDSVIFDSVGLYAPSVTVYPVTVGTVTVNLPEYTYYYFMDAGGGAITGFNLEKSGAGILELDVPATFSKGIRIAAGTVQIGNGGGVGSIGGSAITNHGSLVFNRTGTLVIPDTLTGSGSILQQAAGTTRLTATNSLYAVSGIFAGTLELGSPPAAGAIYNDGTLALNLASDAALPNDISGIGGVTFLGPAAVTVSGMNTYAGPTALLNASVVRPAHPHALSTNTITVGNNNQQTARLELAGGLTLTNPLAIGPRAYLPTDSTVPNSAPHFVNASGANTLDPPLDIPLAGGGNVCSLQSDAGLLVLTKGVTFTAGGGLKYLLLKGAGAGHIQGPISQTTTSSLVLHKLDSGTWTLSGDSGLRGPTVVSNGTLMIRGALTDPGNAVNVMGGALAGAGAIAGPVLVANGGTLAPGAPIGTLTIGNTLTLEPGSITAIEIDKAASASDRLAGLTQVSYGGTLAVTVVTGTLADGDAFKLFDAQSYSSAFSAILPASPGPGLDWDTGTLAVDGTLRVRAAAVTEPPVISAVVIDGASLIMSGAEGVAGAAFSVVSSTNAVAPLAEWAVVGAGTFGADGAFSVTNAIAPGESRRFYLLRVP